MTCTADCRKRKRVSVEWLITTGPYRQEDRLLQGPRRWTGPTQYLPGHWPDDARERRLYRRGAIGELCLHAAAVVVHVGLAKYPDR